jgi:hypothetical protein
MIMDHPPGLLFVPCFSGSKRPLLAPGPGGSRNYIQEVVNCDHLGSSQKMNVRILTCECGYACSIHYIYLREIIYVQKSPQEC